MIKRLAHCVLALIRALDIVGCALWLSLLYPFGLAARPTGYETISCYIGRAAFNRMPWAMRMARLIDWAALKLGDEPNHCLRSFTFYQRLRV